MKAWEALRLYRNGYKFLRIEGEVTLEVGKLEPALLVRAKQAVKRGFGTAAQGATHKLLGIIAKHTGYNADGFPYSSYSHLALYAPRAAADEFKDVADTLEALTHLDGSRSRYGANRNEECLMFSASLNLNSERRSRLRKVLKEQATRWMIYRQPMLDFLNDPTRKIVWEFDSEYREKSNDRQ